MNHILNGVFIRGPFKHDGISYPANWCQLVTAEERAAIGVIDVPVPALPEDYSADAYEYVEDATQAPYAWYRRKTGEEIEAALRARIPQSVTRFQARAALHLAGHLEAVEALMAHGDTPMLARLAWVDAQEFRRQSPTVLAMAQALGLTDDQLDELFTSAAQIEA